MPATHADDAVRRARLVSSNRNCRYTDTVATANQVPKNQVIYTVVTLSPEMVTIIRVYDRRKACHLVQIRQALHRYESLAREVPGKEKDARRRARLAVRSARGCSIVREPAAHSRRAAVPLLLRPPCRQRRFERGRRTVNLSRDQVHARGRPQSRRMLRDRVFPRVVR